jgi:hypothetical protein
MRVTRSLVNEYEGYFGQFFQKDAQRSADRFNDTIVTNGIPRWPSNNNVPPQDLLDLWNHIGKPFNYELATETLANEISETLRQYKISRMNYTPGLEELYEMQAAFGKGVTVQDVITGKEIQL